MRSGHEAPAQFVEGRRRHRRCVRDRRSARLERLLRRGKARRRRLPRHCRFPCERAATLGPSRERPVVPMCPEETSARLQAYARGLTSQRTLAAV